MVSPKKAEYRLKGQKLVELFFYRTGRSDHTSTLLYILPTIFHAGVRLNTWIGIHRWTERVFSRLLIAYYSLKLTHDPMTTLPVGIQLSIYKHTYTPWNDTSSVGKQQE